MLCSYCGREKSDGKPFGNYWICNNCINGYFLKIGFPWKIYISDLEHKYISKTQICLLLDEEISDIEERKRFPNDIWTNLYPDIKNLIKLDKYYRNLFSDLFSERISALDYFSRDQMEQVVRNYWDFRNQTKLRLEKSKYSIKEVKGILRKNKCTNTQKLLIIQQFKNTSKQMKQILELT